jgi:hypothetical protein
MAVGGLASRINNREPLEFDGGHETTLGARGWLLGTYIGGRPSGRHQYQFGRISCRECIIVVNAATVKDGICYSLTVTKHRAYRPGDDRRVSHRAQPGCHLVGGKASLRGGDRPFSDSS